MRMLLGRTLCAVLVAAAAVSAQPASAPAPPPPVVVESVEGLTAALAGEAAIRLRLPADLISPDQEQALRSWVARGGTLVTETTAAGLFGFRAAPVTAAERLGHGVPAAPLGSSPLMGGVEDVWFRFAENGALLLSHPDALPLLRVADPRVPYDQPRYAAAELWFGRGRVIHRPTDIDLDRGPGAPDRLSGVQFESNLAAQGGWGTEAVILPVDALAVAHGRVESAAESLRRRPEEAKDALWQAFLAFRLWWVEHLIATGKLDEATRELGAVAAELPEDPLVYLAVARLNDALGRTAPAEEARRRAAERFKELRRTPPGPDNRQLRVDWPQFVEVINALGAAWENPTAEAIAAAQARTAWLMGLDAYRGARLADAETAWATTTRLAPQWAPGNERLALLYATWGRDIHQAARQQAVWFERAAEHFRAAAAAPAGAAFDAAAQARASAWATYADAQAALARRDPPDAVVRDRFVFRFDGADRRFQVGPLLNQLIAPFERAYDEVAKLGVFLDDTEVIIHPDALALRAALPEVGATRQALSNAAAVGRRVHIYARVENLGRAARLELTRVMANALTEGTAPPPLWLTEGLASMVQQDDTWAQMAGVNLGRGHLLSIPQINDPAVFYRRNMMDHAFGQSELMVEALLERFGPDAAARYLTALGWYATPAAAFEALTGLSQEDYLAAFMTGRLGFR